MNRAVRISSSPAAGSFRGATLRRCRSRASAGSSAPVRLPPTWWTTSSPGRPSTLTTDGVPGPAKAAPPQRLRQLTTEYLAIAARLREGGGKERAERMRQQGKLPPRERVTGLLDRGAPWVEIGLPGAYDRYDGQAPGAGVITGLGVVHGREVVVVANDATVKAGAWWPGAIPKMLRAPADAMRPA